MKLLRSNVLFINKILVKLSVCFESSRNSSSQLGISIVFTPQKSLSIHQKIMMIIISFECWEKSVIVNIFRDSITMHFTVSKRTNISCFFMPKWVWKTEKQNCWRLVQCLRWNSPRMKIKDVNNFHFAGKLSVSRLIFHANLMLHTSPFVKATVY